MSYFKTGVLGLCLCAVMSCASEEKKLYKQATELQQEQQYEASAALYQKVIQAAPESDLAQLSQINIERVAKSVAGQGDSAMVEKNFALALAKYEKASKLTSNPEQFNAKMTAATTALQQKVAPQENDNSGSEKTDETVSKDGLDTQDVDEIQTFVESWQAAWEETAQTKNLAKYQSHYAPSFYSEYKKQDYAAWMAAKQKLANNTADLKIGVQNLTWELAGNNVVKVRFRQTYTAPGYSDVSSKTLTLQHIDKDWKIVAEESQTLEAKPNQNTKTQTTQAVNRAGTTPQATLNNYFKAWENRNVGDMELMMHNAYRGNDGAGKAKTVARLQKEANITQSRAIDTQFLNTKYSGKQATVYYKFNYYDTYTNGKKYNACLKGYAQLSRFSDNKWYVIKENYQKTDC